MKINKSLLILSMLLTVFVSCQDNSKQNQNDELEMTEEAEGQTFVERQNQSVNDVQVTIKGNPELSTFANRMNVTELNLDEEENYTVFAPSNNAYSYLHREHGENVLDDVDFNDEINFLIVEGEVTADSLRNGIEQNNGTFSLPTLQGEHLLVSMQNDSILVRGRAGAGATILESDIEATNGLVHIISAVILPGDVETNVELQE
ncbi:hypothetical protein GCM10007103_32660 [Salinimicrobium marinum]|uniref:FAS1 domain-containing protein n=1 Tax=Salinimicrobium marinum TaxID=680283 RepID=A0A918SMA9_9FLAO|nr:fasciclin domain-containing protein [Salinimicrobium marinum]GHA49237.1 hypothetical protein GCM10007103_32660 [Salinimicrobium marinum]